MWGWVREKRGSINPAHPAVGRWGGEGQPGGGSSPRTGAPSRGEGGGGQWAAEGASPELEDGGRGFGPLVAASQRSHSPPPCEDMGPLFLRHWHFHRTVGAVRGLGVWGLSFDSVCCRRTLPASYLALWGPQSSMRLRKGTWGARAPWGKGSVLLGPCPTQDRDLWEELGVALSVPAGCSKEPTDLLLCRPPQKASTHGGWGLRELDHLSSFPQPPSILNVERPVGTFLLLWDGVWRVSPHPWHGHLQCRSRGLLGAPVRNTPGGNPIASFLLLSRLGGGAMLA